MHWIHLSFAIAAEVVATMALKATAGFTRLGPSLVVVAGYALAFYLLALALRAIPVGVAYAIWSAAGIIAVSLLGYALYRETLSRTEWVGIATIVLGVVILRAGALFGPR